MLHITWLMLFWFGFGPAATDGKSVFTEKKCNKCHTIESQSIAALPKANADDDDDEAKEPKDLSNIGNDLDASQIKQWLQRTREKEGKKHKKKFVGSDEELEQVATWLAGLKT